MTHPNVPDRKTKRADELKTGDWLAAMQITDDGDRPSEVLDVFPYADDDGPAVLLVWRAFDGVPRSIPADAHTPYELATEAEIAEDKAGAERAERIADIRRFADWLEQNPWAPTPNYFEPMVHLDERHIGGPSAAEAYAKVRDLAERLGVEVEERLDDRTKAQRSFGKTVNYEVIAWHPDGRPVEQPAEPEGLDYQRDTADGSVPGPRPAPHFESGLAPGVAVEGEVVDPVTVYFSFGHGPHDPDTGEHLIDKYVTIIGPSWEACREAMFASRFGRVWSFDYPAGSEAANKWIPRWTEHERIDLFAAPADEPVSEAR